MFYLCKIEQQCHLMELNEGRSTLWTSNKRPCATECAQLPTPMTQFQLKSTFNKPLKKTIEGILCYNNENLILQSVMLPSMFGFTSQFLRWLLLNFLTSIQYYFVHVFVTSIKLHYFSCLFIWQLGLYKFWNNKYVYNNYTQLWSFFAVVNMVFADANQLMTTIFI